MEADSDKEAGLVNCMAFGVANLVAPDLASSRLHSTAAQLLMAGETIIGVGLVGLMEFVLGNRIRA